MVNFWLLLIICIVKCSVFILHVIGLFLDVEGCKVKQENVATSSGQACGRDSCAWDAMSAV